MSSNSIGSKTHNLNSGILAVTTNSKRIKLNHKRVAKINSSYFSSSFLRKRVYASSLATFAVKAFFEEQGIKIIEGEAFSDNFYLLESLDLADIKLNNVRIDVRCSINKPFNQVWIPKKTYKMGYRFDYFIAVILYPEKDRSEIAGYIAFDEIKDIISADTKNDNYFIIDSKLLQPIEDLPAKLINMINSETKHSEINELEHGVVEELFVNFLDNTLTSKELAYLEKHLINCDKCKEKLVTFYLFDNKIRSASDPRVFLQEDIPIPKETNVFKENKKENPRSSTQIPSITESTLYETINKPVNLIETVFNGSSISSYADEAELTKISNTEETINPTPTLQENLLSTPEPKNPIEPEVTSDSLPSEQEQIYSQTHEETFEPEVTSDSLPTEQEQIYSQTHEETFEPEVASESLPIDQEQAYSQTYEETFEPEVTSDSLPIDQEQAYSQTYEETFEPEVASESLPIDQEQAYSQTYEETFEPEVTSDSLPTEQEQIYSQTHEETFEPSYHYDDSNQLPYTETYEPPFKQEFQEDNTYDDASNTETTDTYTTNYLQENNIPIFEEHNVQHENYDQDSLSIIPEYLISPMEKANNASESNIKEDIIDIREVSDNPISYLNDHKIDETQPVSESEVLSIKTIKDDTNIYNNYAQSNITFSDTYENESFEDIKIPETQYSKQEEVQPTSEKVTRIEDYIKKNKGELQEETKTVNLPKIKKKKKLPITLVASFAILAGIIVTGTVSIGLLTTKPVKDLIAVNNQPTDDVKSAIEQKSKYKALSDANTSKENNLSTVSQKLTNTSNTVINTNKLHPTGAEKAVKTDIKTTHPEDISSNKPLSKIKNNITPEQQTSTRSTPKESQDKQVQEKINKNKNVSKSITKPLSSKKTQENNNLKKQEQKVPSKVNSENQAKKELKKHTAPAKQVNKVENIQKKTITKNNLKETTIVNKANTSKKAKTTNIKKKETLIAMGSPAPPLLKRAISSQYEKNDEVVAPVTITPMPAGYSKAKIKHNNLETSTLGGINPNKSQISDTMEKKQSSKDLLASLNEKEDAIKVTLNPVNMSVNDSVSSANILWKPTSSTQIPGKIAGFINTSVQKSKSNLNQSFKANNISGQFQTVIILIKINNSKKTVSPIIVSSSGSSRVDNIILSSVRKGFSAKSMPGCDGACKTIEIKLSIVM